MKNIRNKNIYFIIIKYDIISRVSTITSSAKSIIEEKIRYKSQYQKVVDFHKCAGHPFFDTIQHDYTIEKPERVKFRVELIKEELAELIDAVKDNNIKEIVDALSDILYVTYGMGAELGIDLDKSFDIVHDSNMTKFCKTEHDFASIWWMKNPMDNVKEHSLITSSKFGFFDHPSIICRPKIDISLTISYIVSQKSLSPFPTHIA